MAKQLMFDDIGRTQLKEGLNELAAAVKVTLGPTGRNVILNKRCYEIGVIRHSIRCLKRFSGRCIGRGFRGLHRFVLVFAGIVRLGCFRCRRLCRRRIFCIRRSDMGRRCICRQRGMGKCCRSFCGDRVSSFRQSMQALRM